MSATLVSPHIFWRYLQRKVTVMGAEMTALAETMEQLVQYSSTDNRRLITIEANCLHLISTWNTARTANRFTSVPCAVSLINYSIFQIKLCSCLYFFPTNQPDTTVQLFWTGPTGRSCVQASHPLVWKMLITCQFVSVVQVPHLTIWSLYDDLGWVHWPGQVCSVRFISIHSLMLPDYH